MGKEKEGSVMMELISVNGERYEVRRIPTVSAEASASVSGNIVKIRVPVSVSREEGFRLFQELKAKIAKSIAKGRTHNDIPINFHNGQQVTIMNRTFAVSVIDGAASKTSSARLAQDGREIKIVLANGLEDKKRIDHITNLTRRVISAALLPEIDAKVRAFNSEHFNFSVGDIRIRNATTRWGSCNVKKSNINLNFRLLFSPENILEYVTAHELAHVKEHNHSKAFWALVESAVPDYKLARKWLRQNGYRLGAEEDVAVMRNEIIPSQDNV